jgi:hypothetical protein
VEVLDAPVKHNGTHNFNNYEYVMVSKDYMRDFWRLLPLSPASVVGMWPQGWRDYFLSTDFYIVRADPKNLANVDAVNMWYQAICCGQRSLGASRPNNPSESILETVWHNVGELCWSAVLSTGVFLLFLVSRSFQDFVTRGDGRLRGLLLFLTANVMYSAVLGNLVEFGENMRYRFETQGLALIAITIIARQITRQWCCFTWTNKKQRQSPM